jgi:hypothetical protein
MPHGRSRLRDDSARAPGADGGPWSAGRGRPGSWVGARPRRLARTCPAARIRARAKASVRGSSPAGSRQRPGTGEIGALCRRRGGRELRSWREDGRDGSGRCRDDRARGSGLTGLVWLAGERGSGRRGGAGPAPWLDRSPGQGLAW